MVARRRRDNLVIAVLAVLAICGGGHAILDAFSAPPPGPSENSALVLIGRSHLAESFATEFIVSYLSATAAQRDRALDFVGDAQRVTLPTTARQVLDPLVVYVSRELTSDGVDVWAVTVSARIVRKNTASVDDSRQYYQVAVAVIEGRLRALALPAAVEPPGRAPELALNYGANCSSDTPFAQVASGFLQALLAGSGDIARYTTSESGITALRPAPFTSIDTTMVKAEDSSCGTNGTTARVLVSVNPKLDGAETPTLSYPLTMIRASGKWQVKAVDSIPSLKFPLSAEALRTPGTTAAPPTSLTKGPTSAAQIPHATQN